MNLEEEQEVLNQQKKKLVLFGVVLLAVIFIVVIIIIAAVYSGEEQKPDVLSSSSDAEYVPTDKMYVHDIYNGRFLIPKFNVPPHSYDLEKFTEKNGRITYEQAEIGIDVSDHQKEIDWTKVKEDGIDFAIIRVGFRGFTQGGLIDDEFFEYNINGALENGIDVGVYFFSQAITKEEAEEEATYVMDKIKDYEITYPVVFDWEPITNYAEGSTPRTANCTPDEISAFAGAFCRKIEDGGYISSYYTNKTMAYNTFDLEALKDHDLWYAEYQPKPSLYYDFDMWQYTESGKVNGIKTNVDINLSLKDYN